MSGRETLWEAVKSTDLKKVEKALSADPDALNQADKLGKTPLYYAALYGFNGRTRRGKAVVDFLLEKGARVDVFAAAYLDRADRAEQLLTREKAEKLLGDDKGLAHARDHQGWTALHHAAERGSAEVARLLLAFGAEVNAKDPHGETPLVKAAHPGPWKPARADEVVDLLLSRGAEVNVFQACLLGDGELVEAMINEDRDLLRARDENGDTPLFHAARNLHVPVASYLLREGADPNAPGREDMTPLHIAAIHGEEDNGLEMLSLLLEAGADPNAHDRKGYTATDYAALYKRQSACDFLRRKGSAKAAEARA